MEKDCPGDENEALTHAFKSVSTLLVFITETEFAVLLAIDKEGETVHETESPVERLLSVNVEAQEPTTSGPEMGGVLV